MLAGAVLEVPVLQPGIGVGLEGGLVTFGVASGGTQALRMMSACWTASQPRASLIVRNVVGAL
jgi:hypothetical protein